MFRKKKHTVIPTASEMRNLSEKYPVLTQENIAVKIYKEAKRGRHHATFANSLIPSEIAKGLKQNGYKVEVAVSANNAPYVRVYW